MSSGHSSSRKRKTDSTNDNMGLSLSKIPVIGKYFPGGKTEETVSSSKKGEVKAEEAPAPIVDDFQEKAEQTASPAKTADDIGEKADEVEPEEAKAADDIGEKTEETEIVDGNVVEPERAKAGGDDVTSSPTKTDDGPPALDREDEKPSELPLDVTPESSRDMSPVRKEEKKDGDDDLEASSSSLKKKKTMADMGYHFKDGKLRTIEGDAGFTFTTQKAYEELGDLIGEVVYDLMEEMGLERKFLEVGRNRRFYFASPDYAQKERILVLIHGSGVVKAGQWARKLIINESLERGAQLEYIKRGLDNNWGVVVLNYNEHCEGKQGRCHAPDAHGVEEWKHALPHTVHADIVVVAHSYGGSVISEAVRRGLQQGDDRVLAVALTDSWFSEGQQVYSVNWNTMKKKLHRTSGTWQMYSGDDTHEGTSAACLNAVFALLEAVNDDTEPAEFYDLLQASETIIMDEFKEKMRKKRVEQGDTASVKSLELEGEKKKKKKKKEEEEEEEEVEEASEDKKENAEVKKDKEKAERRMGGDDQKKDEEEDKKENAEKAEKSAVGDQKKEEEEDEKMEVEEPAVAPERNPSDNDDDSDEGVQKDASSPERSDAEQ